MGITVLSLFDGCSRARVALERLNIQVDAYYASEVDKWAIQIAQKNYPDTIQLGDIREWASWDIKRPDLIIGGSPCQDLSFAGKQKGLKGERLGLFFEYVNILNVYQPEYFLLENVKMSAFNEWLISFYMGGIKPIKINSALVSAQTRNRLYWTNIQGVGQPEDKELYLKDILEKGVVDRDKSYCIDANYWKGTTPLHYAKHHRRQIIFDDENTKKGFQQIVSAIREGKPQLIGFINKNHRGSRVYSIDGKSVTLCSSGGGWGMKTGLYFDNNNIRKLTPLECERLQTLPDNYTAGVSNTQRYKMLGNGFTVDVIAHILSHAEGLGVKNEKHRTCYG